MADRVYRKRLALKTTILSADALCAVVYVQVQLLVNRLGFWDFAEYEQDVKLEIRRASQVAARELRLLTLDTQDGFEHALVAELEDGLRRRWQVFAMELECPPVVYVDFGRARLPRVVREEREEIAADRLREDRVHERGLSDATPAVRKGFFG